jgi:formate hydrogenlyase subunit 3/multisubunit Na+/H+ antiporter MnhD subunit
MSLSAFGLVLHERTASARRAAKVYLVFAVLGEVLLLVALIMVAHNAGTLELEHVVDRAPQHLLMALLLVGFGIKAGVPLLHLALPPVYAAAPLAAAVPMAGALLHLGLYGWMRFLPLGQVALPTWSAVFVGVGAMAVLYGTAVGLTQRQARSLLAYSSISQMGLMVLGLGIGLGSPEHWPTVQAILLLFALHHALAKGALFHGLGVWGRARIGLWLPALALAGLPLTGGALAKGLLKSQVHLLPDAWSVFAAWVIPLGSVGTTLLMARFLYLALKEKTPGDPTAPWVLWCLLAGMLLLPWIVPLPLERTAAVWGALWPVLLAAGLAWIVIRGAFSLLQSPILRIPSGDMLILIEKLLKRMPQPHAAHPVHKKELEVVLKPQPVPVPIALAERILGRWSVVVGLLLFLMIGFFLLLAQGLPAV